MATPSDHLNHIATFVRVAEARGFTSAARRLGISTAAVSKSVARLENRLGVKLLNRTTRSISLTDDGELFYQRCRGILSDLEGAEAAVTRASVSPRGKLRVHSPMGLGRRIILPSLSLLTQRYPDLSVDMDLSDRTPDLAEEGIDAALRVGAPADSRLIARPLSRSVFVTCASPAYLAARGVPQTPDDLARHNCLAYVVPQTGRYHDWEFQRDGRHLVYTPAGTLNVNNAEALLDAVIAGGGIARVAAFLAARAVQDGRLRLVLADWIAPGPQIHLVYLPNRHLSPRVRVFADLMAQVLPPAPPWEAALGLAPHRR
ncbi:LysR family transcriptional regulator [Bordetella petrii]|uniref:LysR family transcriptional regulator n=1 Tax=Bordetella petrii TaxID=94624 RepID=UPI001A961FD6|nr:LysR family transcriptional regulator [Bordetella petrii]MBO1114123.1 LysR family transcriptional regulator [Bordetella petrii]